MICNYFSGRTGNQMFQYAFVRKLMEIRENKDSLVFNFSPVSYTHLTLPTNGW